MNRTFRDSLPFVGWFIGLAFVIAMAGYSSNAKKRDWERFANDHHCHVTARVNGQTVVAPTLNANGQVGMAVGGTSDQTGWTCDDGVTYYRED